MSTNLRIHRFTSPALNRAGRMEVRWQGPGDVLPLVMEVEFHGAPERLHAEAWTNVNTNDRPWEYRAVPLVYQGREAGRLVFTAGVPLLRVGNYRVTGRVFLDGQGPHWASQDGVPDLPFRPRDASFEGLNLVELSVPNANPGGTLADVLESGTPHQDGRYTLDWVVQQGKNAIWLLPPFVTSSLVKADPADDAASPYAIADFFSVRPELARRARGLRGEAARQAALEEMHAFLDAAHQRGLRVILDLPLNHLGHGYRFRDLFVEHVNGVEVRTVRAQDFSLLRCCPHHAGILAQRCAAADASPFLECLAPWLFGARDKAVDGARHPREIAPGGWFEWPDTLQLNHGRVRTGYRAWQDLPVTAEHRAVMGWLTRVLRFWAVDMGVDGFRLDHLCGMPPSLLEESVNLVQADVDAHAPGRTLLLLGEDFDTAHETAHWVDYLQGGWFEHLLRVRRPAELEATLEDPWFRHLLSLSSHDEERYVTFFGPDRDAATQRAVLLQFLGGPVSEVMGDHYGETQGLPFKQTRLALSPVGEDQVPRAALLGHAGRLHRDHPALRTCHRRWLRRPDGTADENVAALLRADPSTPDIWLVVVANLDPRESHAATLDASGLPLAGNRRHTATDLLSGTPWGTLESTLLTVTLPPARVAVLHFTPAPPA